MYDTSEMQNAVVAEIDISSSHVDGLVLDIKLGHLSHYHIETIVVEGLCLELVATYFVHPDLYDI